MATTTTKSGKKPVAKKKTGRRTKPEIVQKDIAIVGTGFSGLCMAIQLRKAGFTNLVLLEKASEVGGTWRENTYPGAACDVQSHLYSFSFDGNPDWSKTYAGWQEIQNYILSCVERYNLRQYIRFNTAATGATYDEKAAHWKIQTNNNLLVEAKAFILGTGPLHVPAIPDIPGLDTFKGSMFHSSAWNHDFDFDGKTVASIGTGGSAIQYVPEIAPKVKQLHVFQRTPPWILPRFERGYTTLEKLVFRRLPKVRLAHRAWLYARNEARVLPIMNPKLAQVLQQFAKLHIYNGVKNPALRKKMMPDYTIGCKRVLISNVYYPTFDRENVELVTDGIRQVKEHSVVTSDGTERKVDAIVLGTGFVTDPRIWMKGFSLKGVGGRQLLDQWKNGPEAYYGITVAGFPNLFQMVGPNTGLGHNSIIYMIEAQAKYIVECLKEMRKTKARSMDLKAEVMGSFNDDIAKKLKDTVWTSGCLSWYTQDDGKNIAIWPGFTFMYKLKTSRLRTSDYHWQL